LDFSKPSRSVMPFFSSKHEVFVDPAEEMLITQPVLGPADSSGPSAPNPMSPSQSDPMPSLLAFTLNWKVPKARN
jgi:hypothetical protein